MSYEIGRKALNLQMTERVAHTEYNDHWEFVRYITGKDPLKDPSAWQEFNDLLDLDYQWTVNDGPEPWGTRGRVTDMGHAVYVEGGTDYRKPQPSPFQEAEDVLSFDAVQEYGLTDFTKLVDYYENWFKQTQAGCNQVISGGYYQTLVSGAIAAFGWDMLLLAAGEDPERFAETTLEGIFQQSLHHYRAWSKTSIEFFMCHDDMVWTEGPFISPDFYRTYIFPCYKQLWDVLREAGKKVLFTSDGTFDMFYEDLAAAGAHGFCFEPTNDLAALVEGYGKTHVIMGGADCRTLTFGTKEDIKKEMEEVFNLCKDCPGFVFATGNHLPANIPLEHLVYYLELFEELAPR